jgi:hypothetical protein
LKRWGLSFFELQVASCKRPAVNNGGPAFNLQLQA